MIKIYLLRLLTNIITPTKHYNLMCIWEATKIWESTLKTDIWFPPQNIHKECGFDGWFWYKICLKFSFYLLILMLIDFILLIHIYLLPISKYLFWVQRHCGKHSNKSISFQFSQLLHSSEKKKLGPKLIRSSGFAHRRQIYFSLKQFFKKLS